MENDDQAGKTLAEETDADLRWRLLRQLSNAVEVLYEVVPREEWPRVVARLEARRAAAAGVRSASQPLTALPTWRERIDR